MSSGPFSVTRLSVSESTSARQGSTSEPCRHANRCHHPPRNQSSAQAWHLYRNAVLTAYQVEPVHLTGRIAAITRDDIAIVAGLTLIEAAISTWIFNAAVRSASITVELIGSSQLSPMLMSPSPQSPSRESRADNLRWPRSVDRWYTVGADL